VAESRVGRSSRRSAEAAPEAWINAIAPIAEKSLVAGANENAAVQKKVQENYRV
jgi:hypothetical protein